MHSMSFDKAESIKQPLYTNNERAVSQKGLGGQIKEKLIKKLL